MATCGQKPSSTVSILGINLSGNHNPLADKRVRQAVSLALDRKAVVEAAYHGYALPASQLVHPNIFGFDPGLLRLEPDAVRAARLIREAGFPKGCRLRIDADRGLFPEMETLSRQLAAASVRLVINTLVWSDLYLMVENGRSSSYRMGISCSFGDASEILNDLHTNRGEYGHRNNSGYSNPALDALIEEADREFNTGRRQEILKEAMRLAMADLPIIPLYLREDCFGLRRGLDWKPRADGMILAKDIHPAGTKR
ncbi:MAG: ABC transporter substrate-binding protein [Candidatus Edwardsbacteria bacterium]|nr:ABC transporter substrate-binding protein [Candidatus Edwardsbacteria bacterium]